MATIQTFGPPASLDGPYPVIRPYRLVDVATVVEDPDPHWQVGAQIFPYPPDLAHVWNPCPDGTAQGTKAEGGVINIPIFGAFLVYLTETCTARGIGDQDEFVRRATAAFAAVESYGAELAFSQGTNMNATQPYLADSDADVLNGGAATSPLESLCLLEDAIGTTGRGGVIHATPGTVTAWEAGLTLDKVGAKLVTRACGTPVVVGTGYQGAQPEGETAPGAHTAWAFATGPVQIRRGEIDIVPGGVAEALDRETNIISYRVERSYLAVWDKVLQAAVLVDRTL